MAYFRLGLVYSAQESVVFLLEHHEVFGAVSGLECFQLSNFFFRILNTSHIQHKAIFRVVKPNLIFMNRLFVLCYNIISRRKCHTNNYLLKCTLAWNEVCTNRYFQCQFVSVVLASTLAFIGYVPAILCIVLLGLVLCLGSATVFGVLPGGAEKSLRVWFSKVKKA